MTRKIQPKTCDGCGEDIKGDAQTYRAQFTQSGTKQGEFLKTSKFNNADFCHACFMTFCKHGYEPKWITMQKFENTWREKPQEVIA